MRETFASCNSPKSSPGRTHRNYNNGTTTGYNGSPYRDRPPSSRASNGAPMSPIVAPIGQGSPFSLLFAEPWCLMINRGNGSPNPSFAPLGFVSSIGSFQHLWSMIGVDRLPAGAGIRLWKQRAISELITPDSVSLIQLRNVAPVVKRPNGQQHHILNLPACTIMLSSNFRMKAAHRLQVWTDFALALMGQAEFEEVEPEVLGATFTVASSDSLDGEDMTSCIIEIGFKPLAAKGAIDRFLHLEEILKSLLPPPVTSSGNDAVAMPWWSIERRGSEELLLPSSGMAQAVDQEAAPLSQPTSIDKDSPRSLDVAKIDTEFGNDSRKEDAVKMSPLADTASLHSFVENQPDAETLPAAASRDRRQRLTSSKSPSQEPRVAIDKQHAARKAGSKACIATSVTCEATDPKSAAAAAPASPNCGATVTTEPRPDAGLSGPGKRGSEDHRAKKRENKNGNEDATTRQKRKSVGADTVETTERDESFRGLMDLASRLDAALATALMNRTSMDALFEAVQSEHGDEILALALDAACGCQQYKDHKNDALLRLKELDSSRYDGGVLKWSAVPQSFARLRFAIRNAGGASAQIPSRGTQQHTHQQTLIATAACFDNIFPEIDPILQFHLTGRRFTDEVSSLSSARSKDTKKPKNVADFCDYYVSLAEAVARTSTLCRSRLESFVSQVRLTAADAAAPVDHSVSTKDVAERQPARNENGLSDSERAKTSPVSVATGESSHTNPPPAGHAKRPANKGTRKAKSDKHSGESSNYRTASAAAASSPLARTESPSAVSTTKLRTIDAESTPVSGPRTADERVTEIGSSVKAVRSRGSSLHADVTDGSCTFAQAEDRGGTCLVMALVVSATAVSALSVAYMLLLPEEL